VCVCFIIITILDVISTTTCVMDCVYLNITRLAFMERYLAQDKCIMYCLESLIQLCLCNVEKVFNMGLMVPRSPSQFQYIFLVGRSLVFSCHKSCTSPLIAQFNFTLERGRLPMKAHKFVGKPMSRLCHGYLIYENTF
jgi:hypothetical protein